MLSTPRSRKTVTFLAVCPALVALAAALIWSKDTWGYFVSRPSLDTRIVSAQTYSNLTLFKSSPGWQTATALVPDLEPKPEELLESVSNDSYYYEHLDILQEVERRGLLKALPPVEEGRLARVLEAIKDSGALEPPTPGYEDQQHLQGLALEAHDATGARLLFVAAAGGQVSNDHYPRYRLLFEESSPGKFRLIHSSKYFVDVAGNEGFEWPIAFLCLVCPLYSFGFPILYVVLARRRKARA